MVNGGRLTEGLGVRVSVFNRKVRGGGAMGAKFVY